MLASSVGENFIESESKRDLMHDWLCQLHMPVVVMQEHS